MTDLNQSNSQGSVGHSADLRTRIAAVLTDQIVNDATVILRRYGANGEVQLSVDTNALADAVIRELEADYILVPKGHTIARIRSAEKLGLTGDGA